MPPPGLPGPHHRQTNRATGILHARWGRRAPYRYTHTPLGVGSARGAIRHHGAWQRKRQQLGGPTDEQRWRTNAKILPGIAAARVLVAPGQRNAAAGVNITDVGNFHVTKSKFYCKFNESKVPRAARMPATAAACAENFFAVINLSHCCIVTVRQVNLRVWDATWRSAPDCAHLAHHLAPSRGRLPR